MPYFHYRAIYGEILKVTVKPNFVANMDCTKLCHKTGYVCPKLILHIYLETLYQKMDSLCGLVVRVSGYRSRDTVFESRRYQTFREAAGLERGPLSLVRTTEELLEEKSSGYGLESRD
jgi:hypothetical protein